MVVWSRVTIITNCTTIFCSLLYQNKELRMLHRLIKSFVTQNRVMWWHWYPSSVSFELLVKAVNVYLHWTVVFTGTIMSAAKPWLNCRLHCSRMSSCPCHMKEWVSLIHWDFYRFRKWRGKTHTYLLDFDEGFSKAEERCFIGSISAWNAMTKSAFIWIVIYEYCGNLIMRLPFSGFNRV